jgi:hypothetical protein
MSPDSKTKTGPELYSRNDFGLLTNVKYIFNEDGSVDWRSMIHDSHLFPNKGWFESRKKQVPSNINGLGDHQLLIKLSGIKELARLRGFNSVSYKSIKCENDHVAVSCKINFLGNYETNNSSVDFEDMANATLNNTSSFATKFLETIACNRAFVRCVRNFLNIHIVGDDEIDKSDSTTSIHVSGSDALSPQGILKTMCANSGFSSFDLFLDELRSWHVAGKYTVPNGIDPKSWLDFSNIPPKFCREFIKILKG